MYYQICFFERLLQEKMQTFWNPSGNLVDNYVYWWTVTARKKNWVLTFFACYLVVVRRLCIQRSIYEELL